MKDFRVIGAYDSETCNYICDGDARAFPILHQLGLINCDISKLNPNNVEKLVDIRMFRHALELYDALDSLFDNDFEFVPVICCHNLSFDMYGLSQWLNAHEVRVICKSVRKPIAFQILDDRSNVRLVIWDTLVFTQCSLERMGLDCGYHKAIGEWDYDLVRMPQTPLTPDEVEYAKRDVYTLLCYMSYFIRKNPDISPESLGYSVLTKTGCVREKRKKRFSSIKGLGLKNSVGKYWLYQNRKEAPKSDDELFSMQACMRGGFTFVSSELANVPFELSGSGYHVYGFDAVSMHPAQIVSHLYPEEFHASTSSVLDAAADLVEMTSVSDILEKWHKPFNVAFHALFEFEDIRPKAGALFSRYGILPLASARFSKGDIYDFEDDSANHVEVRSSLGYSDTAESPEFAFGKLVSAKRCRIWLTEQTYWEVFNCYDFSSRTVVCGYLTGRFCKPTDMAIISVMQFYKAKNEFKKARSAFYAGDCIDNADELLRLGVSNDIVDSLVNGSIDHEEVERSYLSLKADLNSLFGIEATNEYRRDARLYESGISYIGEFGIQNAPKTPKAWYQFGMRIVGWSRIAQICAMSLVDDVTDYIVNGDTDSIKIVCDESRLDSINDRLSFLARAVDDGKFKVCARVHDSYPDLFDPLFGIGHYELEFSTDYFCAGWNKAYCKAETCDDGKMSFDFTIAGIPASKGLNTLASRLFDEGRSFSDICNILLGFNVVYSNDLIHLNARKFPEWGETFYDRVVDYLGNSYQVCEPMALALYPMSKVVNDTGNVANFDNMAIALRNNSAVNTKSLLISSKGIFSLDDFI